MLDDHIGTLSLWATRDEIKTNLIERTFVLFIAIVSALGFALLVVRRLQSIISKPIQALADTAAKSSRATRTTACVSRRRATMKSAASSAPSTTCWGR